MGRITVKHRRGQSFDIRVRGYALISDEPATLGGDDEGPTPTELVVAGLAACSANEVVTCMASLGEKFEPTEVGADFAWNADGSKVTSIGISVTLPGEISTATREKVLQAMMSCPARQMLAQPPAVKYEFKGLGVPALVTADADDGSWPQEPPPDVDSQG